MAFSPVDEAMVARTQSALPPGGGLLVVTDGQVAFEKVYEPDVLDQEVPLGAVGDWMTAVVAAALVDEGLMAFDAPLPGTDRSLAELLADGTGAGAATVRTAAETATGRPWDEVFRTRLAEPLRLTGTGFTPVAGVEESDPGAVGSGRTTLRDLGTFADLVLNDGVTGGTTRVVSAEAMRRLAEVPEPAAVSGPGPAPETLPAVGRSMGSWALGLEPDGHALDSMAATEAGIVVWVDRARDAFAVLVVDDEAMAGTKAVEPSGAVISRLPEAIDAVRRIPGGG